MDSEVNINFRRIAKAIDFIKENYRQQPDLEQIAKEVNLSPYHFQRLFTEWAGTSPKKFLEYISIEHAKKILTENTATLSETAYETGLSGTGRLHDLFINIEGMTPAEYRNGGKNLSIRFSFSISPFGNIIIASTEKGVCYMAFCEEYRDGLNALKEKFPHASFSEQSDSLQQNALQIFKKDWNNIQQIRLHLKGTDFQLKVWEALLRIPMGQLSTYGAIANGINKTKASRAVGTAIGSNPVAYLIPCHRVIRASGIFGGYRWGSTRKTAIIGWENAQTDCQAESAKI